MKKPGWIGIALLVAALLVGCSGPKCSSGGPVAFEVFVRDAVTGAPVCNATVTASGAAATVSLEGPTSQSADCFYASSQSDREPAGTYVVTASAPGYATESVTGVVVNQDSCGHNYPLTAPITITLPPQ